MLAKPWLSSLSKFISPFELGFLPESYKKAHTQAMQGERYLYVSEKTNSLTVQILVTKHILQHYLGVIKQSN